MKSLLILFTILLVTILTSACNSNISDSAMQTAVSQVILTSSAGSSETEDTQPGQDSTGPSQAEFDELNSQLDNAQLVLTEQAASIAELQNELKQVYVLLTPSITPTALDTPTPTNTSTPTPRPTLTEFVLPWYHKYVVAVDNAPLFTYKKENDAGYPIMMKTNPVQKFQAGEVFIVDVNRVRADGGAYFYVVIGPKYAGYYVRIGDVKDQPQ